VTAPPISPPTLLLLSQTDVAALLTLDECIEAVEDAFRAYAEGRTLAPALMHIEAARGEFHIKAGGLPDNATSYFGLKVNGGFFQNPVSNGLPAIQGIIYLADAETGRPVAIMDSIHITTLRTGAATAVAARYLAREDASVVTICGAGRQGRIQLASLSRVRPIKHAYVWDRTPARAAVMSLEMSASLGIRVTTVGTIAAGSLESDIVVTCTASRAPLLGRDEIKPGTFIAAVGADSPDKRELDPQLVAKSTVVTDITAQCAAVGELHHAIDADLMRLGDVHAEIGQIITRMRPGRTDPGGVILYDSTGTAIQDVACAAAAYRKAIVADRGVRVGLSEAPPHAVPGTA